MQQLLQPTARHIVVTILNFISHKENLKSFEVGNNTLQSNTNQKSILISISEENGILFSKFKKWLWAYNSTSSFKLSNIKRSSETKELQELTSCLYSSATSFRTKYLRSPIGRTKWQRQPPLAPSQPPHTPAPHSLKTELNLTKNLKTIFTLLCHKFFFAIKGK